jgi:gliding motility-associated-like protein
VRDNTGLTSDTATVSLCINPINDCPIPVDDVFNINEGDIIDSTLIFNDFDIEGDILQIHVTTHPSLGGFSWNNDGTFIYFAPEHINKPGPEIITFDYTLSDESFVLCDSTATVTIIINYENDCPIVLDDSITIDASKQSSRIIFVLANDYDPDPDDKIDTTSVTIITAPSFGEAIANINGTITYNHEVSPVLSDYFIYSVKDYEGCEVQGVVNLYFRNVKDPIYKLPNYFTPNGDPFNEHFVIKYEYILEKDMSFEVKIYDRYQRIVYEGAIKSSDKIWSGINSFTSQIEKTDFYYYEITPIEYIDTPYQKIREKLIGVLYLDKDRY